MKHLQRVSAAAFGGRGRAATSPAQLHRGVVDLRCRSGFPATKVTGDQKYNRDESSLDEDQVLDYTTPLV